MFASVSAGTDTKAKRLGVAAHLRLVMFVSLRMVASAEAPSAPKLLVLRLRAKGRLGNSERVGVSMGADRKANTRQRIQGRGALELLDLCLFEDGSEHRGALSSNTVVSETASEGQDGKQ